MVDRGDTFFFKVNEKGSEAAAVTVVFMGMNKSGSGRRPPKIEQWKADRPFLFMLRDKLTGMLLFQGRVVDPMA